MILISLKALERDDGQCHRPALPFFVSVINSAVNAWSQIVKKMY